VKLNNRGGRVILTTAELAGTIFPDEEMIQPLGTPPEDV
jgi:hypothetical protein